MEQDVSDNEGSGVTARKCTVLNVEVHSPGVSMKSRRAIITLGGDDGTIDRVAINARDGVHLVERLAFAFRLDERPASIKYGSRKWFSRNSILRAEIRVHNDVEQVYDRNRRSVPDVVEHMNRELAALKRSLAARGDAPAKRAAAYAQSDVGAGRRDAIG
jgi:hypothetical protein